jgi:hypothetical protein
LNKRAVHLPFSNVAEGLAEYGSDADLLLLSTVQGPFICLNLRPCRLFTVSVTKP